ncbi:MAG: tetratricopeptide repeat protein [Myxococcales bacterium]|nr:tetratricopeptide repeat protein [Myxococcales bacterium]
MVGLVLAACAPPKRGGPRSANTQPASDAGATAQKPSPPPPAPASPIGLTNFDLPPAEAVSANARGVGALAKGDLERAIRELTSALDLAPHFTLARYNLACALARAGKHAEARAALEAVWEADFVGTRVHAAADADLADFWKSAEGRALSSHIPELEARYQSAIEGGVRSILWRDGPQRGVHKPAWVRVGVFDPASKRFVAVAPTSPKVFFAFAPQMSPYAIVATGAVNDGLGGDLDEGKHLDAIKFYAFGATGAPVAVVDANIDPYSGTLEVGSTGAKFSAHQARGPIAGTDKYGALFELRWGAPATRRLYNGPPPETASRDRPVVAWLGYNHWGYPVTEVTPGFEYKSHELVTPDGKKVPIPKALAFYQAPPRKIVASPRGDRVVLVWNAAALVCDPTRDIPGHYKLALVDTTSGAVRGLGEGEGSAHATFTTDGRLYVQRGRRVFHVGETETPLPDGVLLVPPVDRDDQCGF